LEPRLYVDGFDVSSGANGVQPTAYFTLSAIVPNRSTYKFHIDANGSAPSIYVYELR